MSSNDFTAHEELRYKRHNTVLIENTENDLFYLFTYSLEVYGRINKYSTGFLLFKHYKLL